MPKINCCLCSRRTDTNKQRVRVGTNNNWEMLRTHVNKEGLNMDTFSKEDHVCVKCHAILAHYNMKDRGLNKTVKNAPVVHKQGIEKSSLRSHNKSKSPAETHSLMSQETDASRNSSNSTDSNGELFRCSLYIMLIRMTSTIFSELKH